MQQNKEKIEILNKQKTQQFNVQKNITLNGALKNILSDETQIALQNFLQFCIHTKKYSQNTINSYLFDIQNMMNFLHSQKNPKEQNNYITINNINQLDVSFFRRWLASKIDDKCCARSNSRAISSIKTFFKYLNENGISENQSVYQIKKPKIAKLLPKTVEQKHIDEIIDAAQKSNKHEWQNLRDKALLMLIFSAGMRISEALNVKKSDIISGSESTSRDFFYTTGKGAKERIFPLLQPVKISAQQYVSMCPFKIDENDNLFISNTGKPYSSRLVQKKLETIRRELNLPEFITPHTLRHSCASSLFANSQDINSIEKIQHLLGHQNLSTTMIYTEVSTKIAEKALENANYWD